MALDEVKYRVLRRAGLTSEAAIIILDNQGGADGSAVEGAGVSLDQVLALLRGLPASTTVVVHDHTTVITNETGVPVGAGVYVYDPTTNIIYGPTNSQSMAPSTPAPSSQVLVSPNGVQWTLSIDDGGHLITTAV